MTKLSRQQKRRQMREGAHAKKGSRRRLYFGLLVVVLLSGAYARWRYVQRYWVQSPGNAEILANRVIEGADPSLPQNSFMSPFMKEKLGWFLTQLRSGRIRKNFVYDPYDPVTNPSAALLAVHLDSLGRVDLQFWLARWLYILQPRSANQKKFDNDQQDLISLTLLHEAVHLEKVQPESRAVRSEHVAEELRTWTKVDTLAFRQMRVLGRNTASPGFSQFDDSLNKCPDKAHCEPAFKLIDFWTPH